MKTIFTRTLKSLQKLYHMFKKKDSLLITRDTDNTGIIFQINTKTNLDDWVENFGMYLPSEIVVKLMAWLIQHDPSTATIVNKKAELLLETMQKTTPTNVPIPEHNNTKLHNKEIPAFVGSIDTQYKGLPYQTFGGNHNHA